MFFLSLPSCTPGQQTPAPGFGWEPQIPSPWRGQPPRNAVLGERKPLSFSLLPPLLLLHHLCFYFSLPGHCSAEPKAVVTMPPMGTSPPAPHSLQQLQQQRIVQKKTPPVPPFWLQRAGARLEGLAYPRGQGGDGGRATSGARSGLCDAPLPPPWDARGCGGLASFLQHLRDGPQAPTPTPRPLLFWGRKAAFRRWQGGQREPRPRGLTGCILGEGSVGNWGH